MKVHWSSLLIVYWWITLTPNHSDVWVLCWVIAVTAASRWTCPWTYSPPAASAPRPAVTTCPTPSLSPCPSLVSLLFSSSQRWLSRSEHKSLDTHLNQITLDVTRVCNIWSCLTGHRRRHEALTSQERSHPSGSTGRCALIGWMGRVKLFNTVVCLDFTHGWMSWTFIVPFTVTKLCNHGNKLSMYGTLQSDVHG